MLGFRASVFGCLSARAWEVGLSGRTIGQRAWEVGLSGRTIGQRAWEVGLSGRIIGQRAWGFSFVRTSDTAQP